MSKICRCAVNGFLPPRYCRCAERQENSTIVQEKSLEDEEPRSPASPLKTFVRKHSKELPPRKVHLLSAAQTVLTPSVQRLPGYATAQSTRHGSKDSLAMPQVGSGTPGQSSKPPVPPNDEEIRRLSTRAVSWFGHVRSINSVSSEADEKAAEKPRINVRRKSSLIQCQAPSLDSAAMERCEDLAMVLASGSSARKLSPEETEQLRKVFDSYDIDGSGTIDLTELMEMCTELGGRITQAEARMLMNQLDKDKSGTVDFEEFKLFWTTQPSLGKYRNIVSDNTHSGAQALLGGLYRNTAVAIAKNTLLTRLQRRATIS